MLNEVQVRDEVHEMAKARLEALNLPVQAEGMSVRLEVSKGNLRRIHVQQYNTGRPETGRGTFETVP